MTSMFRILAALLASSVVTILVGIVRQKAVAVEVGPAGVGQLGLLLSLVGAAATLGGLGLATSGVQRVSTRPDPAQANATHRGLIWATAALGIITGLGLYLIIPFLGSGIGGDARLVAAVAAAVTVASTGQLALLNGLGLVRKIAWMNGIGAVIGTAVTLLLLRLHPAWGILAAVLAPLTATLVLGWFLQAKHVNWSARVHARDIWAEIRPMLSLGAVFALGVGISTAGQFAARWFVARQFGDHDLGQYQAAWSVTVMYLSVLLNALSVEFFPRVSRVVAGGEAGEVDRVVHDQVKLVLTLAVPVISLATLASPLLVTLLYTPEFGPAADLMRYQFIGDTFKLTAWVLSYALLARAAKWATVAGELVWIGVYFALLLLLSAKGGVVGTGWAYVGAYAAYLAFMLGCYHRIVSARLSPLVLGATILGAAVVSAHVWASSSTALTALAGGVDVLATLYFGWRWWTRRRASSATGLPGS